MLEILHAGNWRDSEAANWQTGIEMAALVWVAIISVMPRTKTPARHQRLEVSIIGVGGFHLGSARDQNAAKEIVQQAHSTLLPQAALKLSLFRVNQWLSH
jgi:hypothetical protein